MEVDLVNRDPNNLNDHLKVHFEDVLAEPEGAHSLDFVWKCSHSCFTLWLSLCYKIASLCFGCCLAAEWGCEFAQLAFYHIWIITPCIKHCEMDCALWRRLFKTCIACCLEPMCESCGALFNAFKK